jgi:hypothetical protein
MKEVIQLDAAYTALAMDIVMGYSFGESVNYLQRRDFALEWMETFHSFLCFLPVTRHAPWMHRVLKSMPFFIINLISARVGALVR